MTNKTLMLVCLEELQKEYSAKSDAAFKQYQKLDSEACDELCEHYFDETKKYLELARASQAAHEEYLQAKGAGDALRELWHIFYTEHLTDTEQWEMVLLKKEKGRAPA